MKPQKKRGVDAASGPAGFLSFFLSFALVFVLGGAAYPLAVGAALLVHETAHFLTAAALGVKLSSVRLGAWGINTVFDYSSASAGREIAVLLSGPAANIAAALAVIKTPLTDVPGGVYFVLTSFALGAVNLLPVRGLDGGAILSAAVGRFVLPDRAWRICTVTSRVFSFAFWGIAVAVQAAGFSWSLLLLSLYFLVRAW
ncbi:MAG: site-2 protease family protein [Clostridia bacterium]|nr:site-2 protease family protein [Clostridia bacterium]MBR7033175.1 site-2 protease family protein [Clostridia bacterium]